MTTEHKHTCNRTDDDGQPLKPIEATCGRCGAVWCDRCDPSPGALCHYCHGIGSSSAEISPPKWTTEDDAPQSEYVDTGDLLAENERLREELGEMQVNVDHRIHQRIMADAECSKLRAQNERLRTAIRDMLALAQTCEQCEGSGSQPGFEEGTEACHCCGGIGEVVPSAQAELSTLRKAIGEK